MKNIIYIIVALYSIIVSLDGYAQVNNSDIRIKIQALREQDNYTHKCRLDNNTKEVLNTVFKKKYQFHKYLRYWNTHAFYRRIFFVNVTNNSIWIYYRYHAGKANCKQLLVINKESNEVLLKVGVSQHFEKFNELQSNIDKVSFYDVEYY